MSEANLRVARKGLDAWNRGDIEAMIELRTPDSAFVPAVAAGVEGGSVTGPEEFRQFFAALDETWETFQIDWEELREVGDRVLIAGRVHAKGRGSGIELDQPMFSVIWFRDDKIARMQSFLDEEAALEAAEHDVVA